MTMMRRAGLVGLGLVGTACISTQGPSQADLSFAVVEGQVTRVDGTPVSGPLVLVTLLSQAQGGQVTLLGQTQVIATAQGRFLVQFQVLADPQTGSTALQVTPPIGSQLAPLDTLGIPVNISRNFPPPDTAYVQMELKPR